MTTALLALATALCGCSAFWNLLDHIRESKQKGRFDAQAAIEHIQSDVTAIKDQSHKIVKLEKDSVRTQLLLLMSDYPDNKQEILEVAEHYFKDIGGNWYMTAMFNTWIEDHDIARPEWLQKR